MTGGGRRVHSGELKLEAVKRLEAGESGTKLSCELGVRRTLLYEWRSTYRAGGPGTLRRLPGRPREVEALAAPPEEATSLTAARRQIGGLQRKVGQQQVELDFFRQALRHVEASRRPSDRLGATASTPSSRGGRGGKAD